MLATVDDPEHRRLLRAFATWRVLHRIRRRAARTPASVFVVDRARAQIVQAHEFLRHLAARQIPLAAASQRDLDRWLAGGPRARAHVRAFLNWAADQHHAPALTVPAAAGGGVAATVDPDARWALARRLMHDKDLDPADRVAGALVVLYAQPVARIARLRTSDVTVIDETVYLRLAHERVLMPNALGELVQQLPHRRETGPSGTATIAQHWLYPGRHAGQPQHPEHLRRRLAAVGIDCRAQRTTRRRRSRRRPGRHPGVDAQDRRPVGCARCRQLDYLRCAPHLAHGHRRREPGPKCPRILLSVMWGDVNS